MGELRGVEALAFLRAINTGHRGSLTTIHADSCEKAVEQLGLLALQSSAKLRLNDIIHYVDTTVDVILHLKRGDGRRRLEQVRWNKVGVVI